MNCFCLRCWNWLTPYHRSSRHGIPEHHDFQASSEKKTIGVNTLYKKLKPPMITVNTIVWRLLNPPSGSKSEWPLHTAGHCVSLGTRPARSGGARARATSTSQAGRPLLFCQVSHLPGSPWSPTPKKNCAGLLTACWGSQPHAITGSFVLNVFNWNDSKMKFKKNSDHFNQTFSYKYKNITKTSNSFIHFL